MKKQPHVMIFCPLPSHSAWRGEGIAQTVENIISSSQGVKYTLVVGKHVTHEVFYELKEIVKAGQLTIIPLGISKQTKKNIHNKIYNSISFLFYGLSLFIFLIKSRILTFLKKSNYDVIFVPIPLLAPFASLLGKKIVTSFWDPFVFEYSGFSVLSKRVAIKFITYAVHLANVVITQSRSNKNYLVNFLDIKTDKVQVVENGCPDYSHYLFNKTINSQNIHNFWFKGELQLPIKRNIFTKFFAYYISRNNTTFFKEKLNMGVLHRLCIPSSKKTSKILIISTQNRPHKNFGMLFEVLNILITKYSGEFDFKFIFTGALPKSFFKAYPWAYSLVFEFPRLSNMQHAYMYSISDLAIHPSLAEGGIGNYPMFEAASLNIPSLSNIGRHMLELEKLAKKSIDILCIDLLDKTKSVNSIMQMLTDKKLQEENISLVNSLRISWRDSGKKYVQVFKQVGSL